MAITAFDIHNQSFSIDRKGYDVDEVDVFLEHVADEIDILNNRVSELEDQLDEGARFDGLDVPVDVEALEDTGEIAAVDGAHAAAPEDELAEKDARIAELEEQLAEKTANDNAISQALIIAQRSADDIIAKANATAAETVADAKEEAQRILDRANHEKQEVIDSIHRLEDDREDAREEYEDLLKDFINDATRKLAAIGGSMAVPTHARVTPAQTAPAEPVAEVADLGVTGQMVPIAEEPKDVAANYTTPQMVGTAVVTAATPAASVVEKDLSGYGDVDADEFDFDELD